MNSKLFLLYFATIVLLNSNYNLINAEEITTSTEIDLSCGDHNDCVSFFETTEISSSCFSGKCKCFNARNSTVKCKPKEVKSVQNFIDDPCPCASTIKHAKCNSRSEICECDDGYVSSDDRRSCNAIVHNYTVSGECDNDNMCVERYGKAYCDDVKMCVCLANYTLVGNQCMPIVGVKDQCEKNEDCTTQKNNTVCVSDTKTCACEDNYVFVNSSALCLPISQYGRTCSDSVDCQTATGSEVCENGKCACDPNFYKHTLKNNKIHCVKKVFVGDNCTMNAECYEANRDYQVMECLNNKCLCRSEYIKTNENRCESGGMRIIGTNLTLLIVLSNLLFIYKITIFAN